MYDIKRFWRIVRGNQLFFIGAFIMAALAALIQMLPPLIIKVTVDSIINGLPVNAPVFVIHLVESVGGISLLSRNIWICSLAIIFFTMLNGLLAFFRGKWTSTGAENIAKKIKDNLYDHLQKLPYEYHVKAQTGDLIQRCTSDVDTIRRFLAAQMVEVARIVFVAAISIVILSRISVPLTIISVVLLPFIFGASIVFFKRIHRSFKLFDEKEGELQTVLQENLSGVRVVRAFGRQKNEVEKFDVKNSELRELGIKVVNNMSMFWSITDFLSMAQMGLVLISGIYVAVEGNLSLGSLIVFNSYLGMLIWPIRQLGRILADMSKMGVSINRIFEILNAQPETDTEEAIIHPLRGEIVFDSVLFEYEKDNTILDGLSFSIKPGETIAVLGPTGSGKSTIMHLLLRLYDHKEGSVTINGMQLRNIQKKWLRERIGLVLQEPFLYSKTVIENIKMAKDIVETEEVYDATRTASIHKDIENFEKGYDTMVGEKGVTLSGGQKQRVAIARTLIKNSDILIFDDSLSAVDTETDSHIRKALKERSQGVTTFIISQRITTLMEADRIFVIENGKLSDAGAHKELITRDGLYSRIWQIQNMLEEEFDDDAEVSE